MPTTEVDLGYRPREPFVEFHKRRQRWAVLVVHRRGGKTVACVADLIDAALRCTKPKPRFAYIAPQLKQAKTVAWEYLKGFGLKIPGATAHESELRLDLPNGGQVRLHGADNPDNLRGIYLDGVVLDEAADMSPRLFNEVLRPALSDRKGWGVWIGTPKGQNDFFDLYQVARDTPDEFYSMLLRASASGIIDRDELDSARRVMTPEQYAQEFECSFQAAIIGAYYGRELDEAEKAGRITKGVYDPALAVHTAWDLGMSDHTVVWFYQTAGMEIRIVDYYASNGYGLDHYAKVLQDRGYVYGRHVLPHDVRVKELGTGRSRLETLEGLGIRCEIAPQLSVEDGINAVRRILPRCWFDEVLCAEGMKALRQYRRHWDDVRKVFLERPCHDWASHPCLIAGSTVKTERGDVPIENVVVGDRVWTPNGFARVSASGVTGVATSLVEVETACGKRLTTTPDHKFFTVRGLVPADALRYDDVLLSGEEPSWTILRYFSKVTNTGSREAITTLTRGGGRVGLAASIALFGKSITARSLMATTSIIGMVTSSITTLPIWNSWRGALTQPCMAKSEIGSTATATRSRFCLSRESNPTKAAELLKNEQRHGLHGKPMPQFRNGSALMEQWRLWLKRGMRRALGIVPPMESHGIPKTGSGHGRRVSLLRRIVSSAANPIWRTIRTNQNSAMRIARLRRFESEGVPVYDLTVEREHCFVANGVLVSNCDAFRYLAVSVEEPRSEYKPKARRMDWVV